MVVVWGGGSGAVHCVPDLMPGVNPLGYLNFERVMELEDEGDGLEKKSMAEISI